MIVRLQARGLEGLRDAIVAEREIPPDAWKARYGRFRGACWGAATHSLRGVFRRFPPCHPRIAGLYFVGPWIAPGPTFPQVLQGAKLVSRLVARDRQAS